MRTAFAGLLTAAALVALLLGWFGSGWSGVRAEQAALRARPRTDAEADARALAGELARRLEELRRSESERPYYHYGNLFHDPRGASQGLSVAPSPLASGPSDPLVRGHFQIDARGAVTVPTVNDAAPELSDPARADIDRALRAQVAALEPSLVVPPDARSKIASGGPLVAINDPPPTPSIKPQAEYVWVDVIDEPAPKSYSSSKPTAVKSKKYVETSKVVDVPASAYAQNASPQQVYSQVNAPAQQGNAPEPQAMPPQPTPQPAPQPKAARPQPQAQPHHHRRRVLVRKPAPPAPLAPPRTVQVTIAPLEWRTTSIDGAPALAAVRRVDTPDGSMTQGLVVLASTANEWLAGRAGAGGARVVTAAPPKDGAIVSEPVGVPGWFVAVDAGASIAAADADADALEHAFLGRFVPVALLALMCGALVVLVVARAEKLARERARFAAAAAHELRTPLAGLQLYGDMIADGLGDQAKSRDYAKRMAEEASRLGRVVSNVLGFSQLERGNLSVHPAVGDVAAAVRASCDRARPSLERAGVALDVAFAEDDATRARFDGDALARVVGNLLDNAEKYGREGADRRVTVALAQVGDKVEVTVVDHGPGVPPRALGRLFRPFVRAAGADGPPGLGLGLALSRSMAQAMSGDLVHRETSGGGATFLVVLPAA